MLNFIDIHGAFDETNDEDVCDCKEPCEFKKPTKRKRSSFLATRFLRKVSLRVKKEVAYEQEYKCFYCHELLLPSYQIDHYISLWQGGSNDRSNLVATCCNCHFEKTAMENDRRSHYFRPTRKTK